MLRGHVGLGFVAQWQSFCIVDLLEFDPCPHAQYYGIAIYILFIIPDITTQLEILGATHPSVWIHQLKMCHPLRNHNWLCEHGNLVCVADNTSGVCGLHNSSNHNNNKGKIKGGKAE